MSRNIYCATCKDSWIFADKAGVRRFCTKCGGDFWKVVAGKKAVSPPPPWLVRVGGHGAGKGGRQGQERQGQEWQRDRQGQAMGCASAGSRQ